jgi:hypothetical protein
MHLHTLQLKSDVPAPEWASPSKALLAAVAKRLQHINTNDSSNNNSKNNDNKNAENDNNDDDKENNNGDDDEPSSAVRTVAAAIVIELMEDVRATTLLRGDHLEALVTFGR